MLPVFITNVSITKQKNVTRLLTITALQNLLIPATLRMNEKHISWILGSGEAESGKIVQVGNVDSGVLIWLSVHRKFSRKGYS